jgi:hypothetical protein
MYRLKYYATSNKDVVSNKWFKTFREASDYSLKLKVPESFVEIVFIDENNPDNPKPESA